MTERIKEHRDFRRLYAKGKSLVSRDVVIYVGKGRKNRTRMGVAVGKKIGCAVRRNRAKRVLRAAFAVLEPAVAPGYDFILVARSATPDRKSTQVAESIEAMLREEGLLS